MGHRWPGQLRDDRRTGAAAARGPGTDLENRARGPCGTTVHMPHPRRVRSRPGPTVEHPVTVEPWFRRRPGVTVAVAGALYTLVLALRLTVVGPEPITVLYCFPVALLAVAFGLWAGLLAGGAGLVLLALWAAAADVHLTAWGWTTGAAPLLLLGGLLGNAADRLRRSEEDQAALAASARRHRDAVEFQDGVVQEMAVAKWALEAGQAERGLDILTSALTAAQAMVSEMLRDADTAGSGRHSVRRSPTAGSDQGH